MKTYEKRIPKMLAEEVRKLLVTIAINALNKHWKDEGKKPSTLSFDDDDHFIEIADDSFDADRLIKDEESEITEAYEAAIYDMAMENLSDKACKVFKLRVFDSLSYREIGQRLNIKEGNARKTHFDARKKVRANIEKLRSFS